MWIQTTTSFRIQKNIVNSISSVKITQHNKAFSGAKEQIDNNADMRSSRIQFNSFSFYTAAMDIGKVSGIQILI